MKNMNNKTLWIAVAVVVVVLVAVWTSRLNNGGNLNLIDNNGTASPSPTSSPASNATKPKATSSPILGAANYSQLVQEYEGRRIQFDDRCQMTPVSPTFKNGTKIMLDNRSEIGKAITINGQKYQIIGYGYQLLILSSKSLPQTMNIGCGSAESVGNILLQATILNQ